MVGYIYRSVRQFNKIMARDENLIISCRACLFLLFFDDKKGVQHLKFLFTFNPWLLNSFDVPSYGSEFKEKYTIRLFLVCLVERRFGSFSAWGNGEQMTQSEERCAWGRLGVGGNYGNLWAVFLDIIHLIAMQKMYISGYVCKTCLKELAINTRKSFCHILKTSIF